MFNITLHCENELQQKIKKNHDQGQVEKKLEISWENIISVLGGNANDLTLVGHVACLTAAPGQMAC